MTLQMRPRAKAALRDLIYSAAETLHDGTYYVHPQHRRSRGVVDAEEIFHELSKAINNGLLDDFSKFQDFLVRVDSVLGKLAAIDISVTTLMVRRDYATSYDDQRIRRTRARKKRSRAAPPSRPRLIVENPKTQ